MKRKGGPRPGWRAMCRLGMEEMMETQWTKRPAAVAKEVVCEVYRRKCCVGG